MKSGIVIIGIGLSFGFAACNADLRDKNVCVMYARALCDKAASCDLLKDMSADECLAPYLDKLCEDHENKSGDPDPRACGAAIEDAPCPGDNDVAVPECKQTLSKAGLISFTHPGGGGTGGSSNTGGSGGSSASGGSGGSGGSGARGGSGGSTGGSGGSTGGSGGSTGGSGGSTGGSGGSTGGSGGAGMTGGVGGSTGGSGGTTGGTGGTTTGICSSYVPDSAYPCQMTVPPGCGTNPVSCGNNKLCVSNSTCVPEGCQCFAGYLAVACSTGLRCSGCAASTWGCTPRPEPGCNGNPSQTAGVCTCSNGRTFNLTCGTTVSCDQRCRQGF